MPVYEEMLFEKKMMKKDLKMKELEQVVGCDAESYFKALGSGISTGWRILLNELTKKRPGEQRRLRDALDGR